MRYVSLHHHSTFSYGDGFARPEEHAARVAELGMSSLALTEHGNTSSHAQLEKAAHNHNIKPIFGLEAYTAPSNMREQVWVDGEGKQHKGNRRKWHLIILAATQKGYINLNKIVTRSWAEGFYQWPTVTWEMLRDHNEGLIVLSGCADSLLSCTLLGGKGIHIPGCNDRGHDRSCPGVEPDIAGARKVIRGFQKVFGDRYFIEVQQFPELERTRTLNPILARLAEETGAGLVATSDVHYPHPDDNEMQKILHAASRNTGTVAAAEASWEYDIRLTLPESDDAIHRRLVATGLTESEAETAIDNTVLIADQCNVVLPRSEAIRFPLPAGYKSAEELVWDKLREGWKFRWPRNARMRKHKREYMERIKYEMEVVVPKDFCDYFLMLSACVIWAKDNGIPVGPARGSAAASLVCYMLRITEVDPLQFPTMMFERFIDIKREDLPDVDLDFADDRRDEVRQHLVSIYGEDHVGNIGNFTRYRGKNSINDVARVYGIPQWEAAQVNDLIIERSGGDSRFDASLQDTFDMFPKAKEVLDRHPEFNYAVRLEGNYKGMGVHAAGIVVSNTPITDTCAFYQRDNVGVDKKTVQVVAYDKKDASYLGMLKADFLGLKTMGMISKALQTIGMKLDELYQIPLDDPKTIEAFRAGDVVGIFQFEGRATRLMTIDVAPTNFMEIADINALSRPGPLFSGASAQYVDVKNGTRKPDHLHPIVDKYTAFSKYQIIYQEQVLGIIREMGGFPVTKIADIRKIISQKLGEASFNSMREEFLKGAREIHGVPEALADKVWRLMVTSATYSFNVAHCISYGMLAFWTMWLKVHHPSAFYAAQLSKIAEDKWAPLIKDAERHGISVRPPDLAESGVTWEAHSQERAVVAGFSQLPGIGASMAERIMEWKRDNPGKHDWSELLSRKDSDKKQLGVPGLGAKKLEKITDWVVSDDPFNLYYARRVLTELREYMQHNHFPLYPNFMSDEIPRDADWLDVTWMGLPNFREYKDYIEDERSRSGKTIEEIEAEMERPDLVKGCVLKCYDDGDEEVYLRFNRFRFPKFKAQLESVRLDGSQVVLAQGIKRKGFGINLQVQQLYIIDVTSD